MKDGNTKFGAGAEIGGHLQSESASGTLGDGYGHKQSDATGIKFGLSALSSFDAETEGLKESSGRDPFTGNPLSRVIENPTATSASKRGITFEIC